MKNRSKKSNEGYYHCGKCRTLIAKIIGVELDSSTSNVVNVSLMADEEKNGVFKEKLLINTAVKDPDNYISTLMICYACGSALKKVSRFDADHHLT